MVAKSSLDWEPHSAQKEILKGAKDHRYISLVCGRRFGKTELCINKLIMEAWYNPGDYVYIAPTMKQAKRIAWRKLKRLFPNEIKHVKWKNESDIFTVNKKGGRILLLGSDDPDSLRGEGWRGAILDEYADMNPYTYEVILPALGDKKGFLWFVGTPKGYNHFYEEFIKDVNFYDATYRTSQDLQIEPDSNYKSYIFKTADNPHFPQSSIDDAKKILTAEYFRQEYEASFENYTGLIYREFMADRDSMILEPIYKNGEVVGCIKEEKEIIFKKYWNYYHGLDTGRHTAGVFKAVDENNVEYIFDEIYDIDGVVDDLSAEVTKKQRGKNFVGNVIDSASQIKGEYRKKGINYLDSEKDILGSIQMVRTKMRNKKWYVLANCKAFIKELSSRKWSERRNRTGKVMPEKENDHVCNAEDYVQLTFLKYPIRIKTPEQKHYEQSLDYMAKQMPTDTWKDLG